MELGHIVHGNFNDCCRIPMERSIRQDLYHYIIGDEIQDHYENETFVVRPYCWDDESEESCKPNFEHKPSGFKMTWYKCPLRDPYCNMEISHDQFQSILYDCLNSTMDGTSYCIDEWWEGESNG